MKCPSNRRGGSRGTETEAASPGSLPYYNAGDQSLLGEDLFNLEYTTSRGNIARRFEAALERRVESREGDRNFRLLRATWVYLLRTHDVPRFPPHKFLGVRFMGREDDVLQLKDGQPLK